MKVGSVIFLGRNPHSKGDIKAVWKKAFFDKKSPTVANRSTKAKETATLLNKWGIKLY